MRRFAAFACLAVLAAGATACGSSGTPPAKSAPGQKDKVAASVIAIVDVAPIYLGKQKGFFDQQNIDLTLSTSQGGAAIVPAVVSGQVQIGFSNMTSLLLAASKGLPVKVVCNGVASTGVADKDYSAVLVKAGSPVHTAADLAGKTVAVNTLKNIGDTTVRASVRKAGGDPKAVRFVELAFPDMLAALQAGRVDAIWEVEPFVTAALLDSQAITGPAVIFGVFGSASSSFCSRTHCAASRVDSCACAELSNSPTEVRTPPPASIK